MGIGNVKGLAVTGACVAAFGAAVFFGPSVVAPRESGVSYLESRGYKVIEGGELDWFNTCGKNVPARGFRVESPEGKVHDQTVCYSLLGKYFPLFGG